MASPATVPVLLPYALEAPYDYLPGEEMSLAPGDFVAVPLGPREVVGVVWTREAATGRRKVDPGKLRKVVERLDMPPLPADSLRFADWVANYTVSPPGMVLRMMMSAREAFSPPVPRVGVRLSGSAPERMTAARSRVLRVANDGLLRVKSALAAEAGVSPGVIDGLVDAGTLTLEPLPAERLLAPDPSFARPDLTVSQSAAAAQLRRSVGSGGYSVTLLDGVTGSGKTEVYFEAVAAALEQGRQALVLLPEIALTGQFIARFEARFGCAPAQWHSELSPRARGQIWRAVATGEARAVVGARSALFLPFVELGLIVVDEEHDPAFKQDDRVSYQARDMAVVRGSLGQFPVILSSATPSIESHVNALQGRYAHVRLEERYSGAALPQVQAIDLRKTPPEKGRWLAPPLVAAIEATLAAGQQTLLFLNRRGYAPLTLCRACGHRFECPQCSAWLVEHRFRRRLECHHCGYLEPTPQACPSCKSEGSLVPCGPGVERIAEEVSERFPQARMTLLSSDATPNVAAMREVLQAITERRADIIIGTQLVAKGHHFPGLATVGVVDGDLGLGLGDPRAAERTWQLLHQVTGRAGREAISGKGYIQTHMPEHPVIAALAAGDRDAFLRQEIAGREQAGYPPFGRLASLLVSAANAGDAHDYARALARCAPASKRIRVLGPADAPLSVIRGRHRVRLLVKADRQADLQSYLRHWLGAAPKTKGSVRLSLDVDPYNFL
ncbi:MAG: primosomal protein N' [Pseudomonadota bacterium]|nr:primosomal protein N' [Pseudomonadota bacterium]